MPYNNKVQVSEGSFKPLDKFEDNSEFHAQALGGRNPQTEVFIAQRVVSSNIRKLKGQEPPLPFGDLAEVTLKKDHLEISFDTQEIAQAFMKKLQKNGIKVKYVEAGDYGNQLIIEHNEVPKFLQGILKMSDAQLENLYKHAKVPLPPQISTPQMTASLQTRTEPPLQTPSSQKPLPRAPTIVEGQGGFTPLSAWQDSHALGSSEQSPSLTHNIKALVKTQTTHNPFDASLANLNQNGTLDLVFTSEALTLTFLDKLKKNGIIAQAKKNPRRTGPDIVDLADSYTITIDSRDVPKFLQGILKMPHEHLAYLHRIAKAPEQQTPTVREAALNAPTRQTFTPGHTAQSTTLQTRPNLSASNLSIKDLYQNLNRQSESLGIKIKAGNIVNHKFEALANNAPGAFKAAEIALGTQQNSPVCLAQEKQGGIDYTLGKNVTGSNRAAAINKVCQLAVQFGKNTEYAFPENADEKATFEALNNALKAKFGDGYPKNPDPAKLQQANMTKEEVPTIRGYDSLLAKYPQPKPKESSNERRTLT